MPQRTLKEAIDLDIMSKITSDDLLAGGMDYYQKIRHNATGRHLENNYQYACAKCGHGVYVTLRNKKPLWQHFRGAPQDCPWWTGDPDTVTQVSANQFQGQQESPLHSKLKFLIKELLQNDSRIEKITIEKTIIGKNGRRKPDVQASYQGKDLSFEVQLATTQIPIILSREKFYQNEKRFLIWLTWQFEERTLDAVQQSFLDVYYRHNKNIFSLDDETIKLSQEKQTLVMRVHAYGYNGWQQNLITLDELVWPENGLPYALSVHQTYSAYFRTRWLEKVTPDGMERKHQIFLMGELFEQLGFDMTDEIDILELSRVINCMLTLEKGIPIGTRENNLTAYANSFLLAKSRQKYADLFELTAKKFGRGSTLQKDSVKKKLAEAKTTKQVKGSFEAEVIKLVFEDWFSTGKKNM